MDEEMTDFYWRSYIRTIEMHDPNGNWPKTKENMTYAILEAFMSAFPWNEDIRDQYSGRTNPVVISETEPFEEFTLNRKNFSGQVMKVLFAQSIYKLKLTGLAAYDWLHGKEECFCEPDWVYGYESDYEDLFTCECCCEYFEKNTCEKNRCGNCEWILRNEEYGDDFVDLDKTMKRLLNPQSCQQLRELLIMGEKLIFGRSWIRQLAVLLPSLTSLDVGQCTVTTSVFRDLCKGFPNLVRLSICGTSVAHLEGISQLKDLEELNLSDLEFRKADYIAELSLLPKLRVLDISGRKLRQSKTFEMYMDCGIILPELCFLDASNNVLCTLDIENIARTHKKLEHISLIGTVLQNYVFIETSSKNLKFLTTGEMSCWKKSFEFYNHPLVVERISYILDRIDELPFNNGEEQNEFDFEKYFETMLDIYRNGEGTKCSREYMIRCIFKLCCNNRSELFNAENKQSLIDFLKSIIDKPRSDEVKSIAWKLFDEMMTEHPNQDVIDFLCRKGFDFLQNRYNWSEDALKHILRFLSKFVCSMSKNVENPYHHNNESLNDLLSYFSEEDKETCSYVYMARFVLVLNRENEKNRNEINEIVFSNVVYCILEIDEPNIALYKDILSIFEEFMNEMSSEFLEKLFASNSSLLFMRFLKPKNEHYGLRRTALNVMLTIYAHTEGLRYRDLQYYQNSQEEHVNYIIMTLENKKKELRRANDPKDFWSIIVSTVRLPVMIQWSKWILTFHVYTHKEYRSENPESLD
ncbi:unnamed protein product [Caenorhabditis brenneri]